MKKQIDITKHNYRIIGNEPVEIVIEMGLGACISEWLPTAGLLAKNHCVMIYERAGINKSPASDRARTPKHIAEELYNLLEGINHTEKIILLAHSQGGLYAQQFCRLYPDMVKKLILLDPLSAEDGLFKEKLTPAEYKMSGVDKSANFKYMYKLARLKLSWISKKLMKNAAPFYYYNNYSREETEDILGSLSNPIYAKTALSEYEQAHIRENVADLALATGFPDIPLILVTHDSALAVEESMKFGRNTREFAEKVELMWQDIMQKYLTFTSESALIRASKSTHYIHLMEPELLVKACSVKNHIDI